jgi:hypothetical protein
MLGRLSGGTHRVLGLFETKLCVPPSSALRDPPPTQASVTLGNCLCALCDYSLGESCRYQRGRAMQWNSSLHVEGSALEGSCNARTTRTHSDAGSGFVRQDPSVGEGLGVIARTTRTFSKKYPHNLQHMTARDRPRPSPKKFLGNVRGVRATGQKAIPHKDLSRTGLPRDSCERNSHERTPGSRTKLPASALGQPPLGQP